MDPYLSTTHLWVNKRTDKVLGQPVYEKENSKSKTTLLRLKIDFESHPVRSGRVGWICNSVNFITVLVTVDQLQEACSISLRWGQNIRQGLSLESKEIERDDIYRCVGQVRKPCRYKSTRSRFSSFRQMERKEEAFRKWQEKVVASIAVWTKPGQSGLDYAIYIPCKGVRLLPTLVWH